MQLLKLFHHIHEQNEFYCYQDASDKLGLILLYCSGQKTLYRRQKDFKYLRWKMVFVQCSRDAKETKNSRSKKEFIQQLEKQSVLGFLH